MSSAKSKRLVREAVALGLVTLISVAVVLPTLISAKDSIAVVGGLILAGGLLFWAVNFVNRALGMSRKGKKK